MLGFLRIKVFSNKDYDIIIYGHEVTKLFIMQTVSYCRSCYETKGFAFV